MSKQDVIDYVMNTPHNTNPAILGQKLDEMGVQADWNQNDPTKADYVKNRTHYIEPAELYEVDMAKLGIDSSLVEGAKPGTFIAMVDEEVAQMFFDNWEKLSFIYPDGTILSESEMETSTIGTAIVNSTYGDLSIGSFPMRGQLSANVQGILRLTLKEEVIHKIPEKYLPDSIGGGIGNVIVINIDEDNAENQVYPEGLYNTIHNMITSNIFDTFIVAGFASAQYQRSSHSYICRIETVDDGYLLVPADYISNRHLHVRPDDTGYIEWMD